MVFFTRGEIVLGTFEWISVSLPVVAISANLLSALDAVRGLTIIWRSIINSVPNQHFTTEQRFAKASIPRMSPNP